MSINEILIQTGMTKYRLQKLSGVPHATLSDLCSGKTQIEKCSGETLYRLAKALQVPMELLLESIMEQKLQQDRMQLMRERSYEFGLVCACKDFTADGSRLYDFCSIKNTIIDSGHNGTGTELDDVLETIEKQQFVNPEELMEHFWDVFVMDAFLGNFDRHNGNWGFRYSYASQTASIAPVYGCGSCLLPQADEKVMHAVLENESELHARIFRFPTSAIKYNDRKINYYDFLTAGENDDCGKCAESVRFGFPADRKAVNDQHIVHGFAVRF